MLSVTKARSLGIIFDPVFSIIPPNPPSSPIGFTSKIYLNLTSLTFTTTILIQATITFTITDSWMVFHFLSNHSCRSTFLKSFTSFLSFTALVLHHYTPITQPSLVSYNVCCLFLALEPLHMLFPLPGLLQNSFIEKLALSQPLVFSCFSFINHQPSHPLFFSKTASWVFPNTIHHNL